MRAAAAPHSAAGRHSVATLSHRLAGPPIETRTEETAVLPAGPSRTRRAFPDTKAKEVAM